MRDGTATYSAKAPWRRYSPQETPSTRRFSQRFTSPRWQYQHSPQDTVESNVTRSPFFQSATAEPTSAITPAASCPIMIGGMRRPELPSIPCTSLPQMPHARTRTSTSSGLGAGTGKSSIANWQYSLRTKAFTPATYEDSLGLARNSNLGSAGVSPALQVKAYAPNLSNAFAFACIRRMRYFASKTPSDPLFAPVSVKRSSLSVPLNFECNSTGCGCHEWPWTAQGVE